jgi:cytochrome c oxidase assembly protein subunit 15
MKPDTLRRMLLASVILVLIVVSTSAFIRLSQAGLGCADWPACYGQKAQLSWAAAAAADPSIFVARGLHRLSASIVAIVLVLVVLLGWDALAQRGARGAALAVLALAAFLAGLGFFTPSSVPAVLLGNLLGGMAMAALLWFICRCAAARAERPGRALVWFALAALCVQISLGGLIGAHRAALACDTLTACQGSWWPDADWRLFNPFIDTAGMSPPAAALQAVAMAHRYGALVIAAMLGYVGISAIGRGGGTAARGRVLLVLLSVQLALGALAVLARLPLPVVLLHNLGAALLLAATAALLTGESTLEETK